MTDTIETKLVTKVGTLEWVANLSLPSLNDNHWIMGPIVTGLFQSVILPVR